MLRVQECVKKVLLLVICIGCTIGCSSVDDTIKFTGKSPVTVQRGHSVVIAASAYNVLYNETKYDSCLVYITSTPTFSCGTISPDVFNYSTKPDLLYTHYGCERNMESFDLAFSLTSPDHNVFTTEHLTIMVTVMSIAEPILKPSDMIILPPDTLKAFVSLNLSDRLGCEYAIVSPVDLPYYGIVTGLAVRQWLPCSSNQSLEYTFNQSTAYPLTHYQQYQPEDRVIVAIKNNDSITYEQIPVIIHRSNDRRMSCVLQEGEVPVAFNCYTSVTVHNLIAQNCSFSRDWKIHITRGYSAISPVTSHSSTFTFGQLQDGMVAYHRKSSSGAQNFPYQYFVYDVYGRVIFNSSVVTKSTALAGQDVQVALNTGIDVVEGQSATITDKKLDFIHHSCPDFTLSLLEGPTHGYFRSASTNETVHEVTLQDLHSANIVFEHSGEDNFGDYVIWEVWCSNITLGQFLQPIRVIMKDNSPPYLSENSAISVYSNNTVQLSQFHLQARDVDSCDANLKYSIITARGHFYSSREDALANIGVRLTQFTQQEIDDGKVWYRPSENTELPHSDIVLFNVSDESPLPNVLPNQKLSIKVLISYECAFCEAVLDPDRLSIIPVVEVAGETNLSANHFSPFTEHFVPYNQSYNQLEFHVVEPPQFGRVIPDNFTMDSLKKGKVVYRHEGVNNQCNDSFVFRVRNITGEELFGKMVVSVVEHNATRSVTLKVNPVEFSIIRPTLAADSIVITDAPVCTEHILFVIESLPESGKLYCNLRGIELKVGSWFSQKHVEDGLLSYHTTVVSSNQNESIYTDIFSFSLHSPLKNLTTNGQHVINYPITYNLLDPMMVLNPPIIPDHCNENEFLCYYNLTVSNINVMSSIANDSELRIVIKDGPSCGRLIHGHAEVMEFTMLQVKMKQIVYEFNASLCNHGNYTDKFGFTVEIVNHPARPVKKYLHLLWSYVMVDQPKIEMNETDKTFTITVRRGGYLNQTSKIFCTKGSYSAILCKTCNQLKVATFAPGKTEANCSFKIENNNIAEGILVKRYYVSLKNPKRAITTSRNVTDIYVSDLEDYPVIQFTNVSLALDKTSPCTHNITVKEGENFVVSAMIERIGDSSKEVSVMCTTEPGTARSSQDYQERDKKWVTFAPGQKIAFCNVTILDDDEYEPQEHFELKLSRPRMLAMINPSASTICVYIEDTNDRPVVFFGAPSMTVSERRTNYTYHIPINLTRKTDFGETEVLYRTKLFHNDTAREDKDFKGFTSQSVVFKSVQTMAYGHLLILPDSDDNESYETLHIELMPDPNYQLGYPSTITITIDSYKVLSFSSNSTVINETEGPFYSLYINRTGSLDYELVVVMDLIVSSGSSRESDDHCNGYSKDHFLSHKNLILSNKIVFSVNENSTNALVLITDDHIYDKPWTVQYCLISPENRSDIRFRHQCIDITVYDEEDYPTVKLEHASYVVRVPDYQEECSVLAVSVVRNNDISQINSTVGYSTINDSAVAGRQYREARGVLSFTAGEERKLIFIKICLHDLPSNQTKKFHVEIVKNDNSTRIATPSVTEVIILGREPVAPFFHKEVLLMSSVNMVLPSGFHRGTTGQRFLVCVTPCDPLLPSHFDASFCKEHGIDNNLTVYEWELSYNNGPFAAVTYSTYFASPRTQILSEFYLVPGSKVRCKATAVDVTGVFGYKRSSEVLKVEEESRPHCMNSSAGFTVEIHPSSPFTGQLQMLINLKKATVKINNSITSRDSIKLSGSLNASGNAVPLLYSQHSDLSVLTYYPARSNSCVLLTVPFTTPGVSSVVATDCGWQFEVWISLHELEKNCHATIHHAANQTSIYLELELAYFHGNVSGVIELEQFRNHLNVSAILFHELPPAHDNASYSKYAAGFIKLLDVSLEDILVVRFQSFANFSGQFLLNASNVSSSVRDDSSNQNVSLFLEDTEQSVNNCSQKWRFHSAGEIPLRGLYSVNLTPCVLPEHLTWSPSILSYCMPMPPVTFQLHVPLAESVLPQHRTLETELLLLKRAKNGSYHMDWRFSLDDTICGGIKIDTQHQQHVDLAVQKITACSTMGGYIPRFNQQASLSGCLTHTPFITKLYTIFNADASRNAGDGFDAKIIDDASISYENVQTGWSFKAAPLFDVQVQAQTQQWFIHVVYSETQNNVVTIKQDIRIINLISPSCGTDDVSTSQAWCEAVVTITIVLSFIVMVLLVVSLICWKWSKIKDGCAAIFGDYYDNKSKTSPLAKIRRSHRFRAEIQELPHAFQPPNGIHVASEQCTRTNTLTATQTTGSSANKRSTSSKKYIVETTM